MRTFQTGAKCSNPCRGDVTMSAVAIRRALSTGWPTRGMARSPGICALPIQNSFQRNVSNIRLLKCNLTWETPMWVLKDTDYRTYRIRVSWGVLIRFPMNLVMRQAWQALHSIKQEILLYKHSQGQWWRDRSSCETRGFAEKKAGKPAWITFISFKRVIRLL